MCRRAEEEVVVPTVGFQRHRHFARFFSVPVLYRHGTNRFIRWFRHTAPYVAFYDTLGIRRIYSRLKPSGSLLLGYCFTPYQRLWLYNGAPLFAFYDTLGIRRTYSRLKTPASSRGSLRGTFLMENMCAIWWHGISTNSGDSYGHQLCSSYSKFIFILLWEGLYVWPSQIQTFWPHIYV